MMKLLLLVIILTFKCSWLSSAPADPISTEPNAQPSYIARIPGGGESMAFVADADRETGNLGEQRFNVQFRRSIKSDNTAIEARRRSMLDRSFIRFGRSEAKNRVGRSNMMRFGRSSWDEPEYVANESPLSKKNDKNLLRFGRRNYFSTSDDEYNDANEVDDFTEMPHRRDPMRKLQSHVPSVDKDSGSKKDLYSGNILRLGRGSSESSEDETNDGSEEEDEEGTFASKTELPLESVIKRAPNDKNILRFGRAGNMMRFGRGNMMRFGRSEDKKNFMRFGRANFMRFGRNDKNLLRFGRAGNFMRFGKRDEKNLMRFGKRAGTNNNHDDSTTNDQLRELYGNAENDGSKQGYGEYIFEK